MNKNARKLIPAVAMLLVSASMLSTASYAWFSMNNKVTAGKMNVNVVTPGDFQISNSYNGTFANSAVAVNSAAINIAPVSSATGIDGSFFAAYSNTVAPEGGLSTEDTDIVAVDNTTISGVFGSTAQAYVDYSFYVKTTSSTPKSITLDTAATGFASKTNLNESAAINALRFAFFISEGVDAQSVSDSNPKASTTIKATKGNIWSGKVNTNADNGAKKGTEETTLKDKAIAFKAAKPKDTGVTTDTEMTYYDLVNSYTSASEIVQVESNKVYNIIIRVWLEGESSNCVVTNLDTAGYKLDIVFVADEVSAGT